MLFISVIACIVIGYLLGSIPSSYLVGKYWGKVNLLEQGKSHVSGTAVYRELGWGPFAAAIAVDVVKGMLAIYISQLLSGNILVIAATAAAAVAGHCWSVFIRFHGGLGATVIFSELFYTGIAYGASHVPLGFLIGGAAALVTALVFKKSSIATILWVMIISTTLFVQWLAFHQGMLVMALLPLILLGIQLVKKKISARPGDVYKNEMASDFKRIKNKDR